MSQTISELIAKTKEYENWLVGLEMEDTGEEAMQSLAYSSENIRITASMYSVYQMFHWTEEGNLLLQPAYQRNLVWDGHRKSLLIESLMLGIPISMFYFEEDMDGTKTVIDGLQRLSSICGFLRGEFALSGLRYLKVFNGFYFEALPKKYRIRILETQLTVNVLDSKCDSMVKFDIFRRINTGGIPLNAQEVRNVLAKDPVRELLQSMSSSREFLQATQGRVRDVRMDAQELCLRFILFAFEYDKGEKRFENLQPLTVMLDMIVLFLNKMDPGDLEIFGRLFRQDMKKCHALLGEYAFTKNLEPYRLNKPLFISWSVVLGKNTASLERLREKREEAILLVQKYLLDETYSNAITSATTSRKNLEIQFGAVEKILEELSL